MYCRKCGSEIPENSKFCPKCGYNQQSDGNYRIFDDRPSSCPNNYLWLSILVTILCCMPFGIVGIVYSTKVDSSWNSGNYDAAVNYSNKARNWSLVGMAVTAVISLIYILAVVILGVEYFDGLYEFYNI